MRKKRIVAMWAICNTDMDALYIGTALTRREMISRHVHDLCIIPCQKYPTEKKYWDYCRKKGDQAVKVDISYTP